LRHSTGRQREADQIIERAAGAIGVDQVMIELARVRHRLGHRLLGDRVEGDALHRLGSAFFAPTPPHMPADRLALAIRVGGEDQAVSFLGLVGDGLQLRALSP
jgi:hypothetical protein